MVKSSSFMWLLIPAVLMLGGCPPIAKIMVRNDSGHDLRVTVTDAQGDGTPIRKAETVGRGTIWRYRTARVAGRRLEVSAGRCDYAYELDEVWRRLPRSVTYHVRLDDKFVARVIAETTRPANDAYEARGLMVAPSKTVCR